MRENIGSTYPSYTNGEKERYVCKPSRVDGFHEGFDRKIQAVKMADVWGIEKIWAGLYQSCAAHGDFKSRRSNIPKYVLVFKLRMEELCEKMVAKP